MSLGGFDRYPGTPGLYVRLGIAAGDKFTLNDPDLDTLNDGNVLEGNLGNLVDVTCQVTEATWRRGATRSADPFGLYAGAGSLRIYDPDGDLDPANTASPYYAHLRPGVVVDLYSIADDLPDAMRTQLFRGVLWELSWSDDFASVSFVDALSMVGRQTLAAGTPTGIDNAIGRAGRILIAAGSPTRIRRLNTGVTTQLQSSTLAGNLLTQLQKVTVSDFGLAYIDRNGNLAYGPGWWKARRIYGPSIPCESITSTTSNDTAFGMVTNYVTVTAPGLSDVSVGSQSSIDRFGLASETVATDLTSTADMTALANYRLAWQKNSPTGFPKEVQFCPAYDTGGLHGAARAARVARSYLSYLVPDVLGSWITVEPVEGITADATIVGESHAVSPDYGWRITYVLNSNPNGWDQPHLTLSDPSTLSFLDYGNVLI